MLSSLTMFFVCYYLPDSTRVGFEMVEGHLIPLVPICGPVTEFSGAFVDYLMFREGKASVKYGLSSWMLFASWPWRLQK